MDIYIERISYEGSIHGTSSLYKSLDTSYRTKYKPLRKSKYITCVAKRYCSKHFNFNMFLCKTMTKKNILRRTR